MRKSAKKSMRKSKYAMCGGDAQMQMK
jgi:hypothetical protein